MKFLIILIFIICSGLFASSQAIITIDAQGDTINKRQLKKKLKNKDSIFFRWDYIGKDKKRYQRLKKGLYLKGNFDYETVKKEVEEIISTKIPDSSKIIIEYYFKDDLCSSSRDNKWTISEINSRKDFTNPIKIKLNNEGITYICLFEKGIKLRNKSNSKYEYYYIDKNNFFREKLFKTRAMCGSFVAIKPNGQTLIRNGEYRGDDFAKHLKPEIWSQLFKK